MEHRALVVEDWPSRSVRLHVSHWSPTGRRLLLESGEWGLAPEGANEPRSGIVLPEEVLPAIAEALAKHLGNALPSQAEVSVLREVLAKEQARVDGALEAGRA